MSKDSNIAPYQTEEDELTLRDLILKIREYWAEIRRNWPLVLLFVVPFTGWFAYQAFQKPVTYTARLTFMMSEDNGGGGISSILGQFGGLLGGGTGEYQLEKILEIARSRRIISEALFERYRLGDREDFFANHVIRTQQLHKKWAKDSLLRGFLFDKGDPTAFGRKENKALLALYGEMIGGEGVSRPMFGSSLNEDTGIMTFLINSRDEMLAIDLLSILYEKLSIFYIAKSIQREQATLDILAHKRDSIARVLRRNDYSAATFDDRNNSLLLQSDKVPGKRLQRDNQLLTLMYGEAIKNAEVAEFALKSSTPFLTLLDVPIAPIKADARGRVKAVITGLLLGFIFGGLFVVIRKVINTAMQ
jgi:hypothetical protein